MTGDPRDSTAPSSGDAADSVRPRPSPRRVLVVGATGRLGVAIAAGLVARGDDVVLTGRDQAKLTRQAASLDRGHGAPATVCSDLTRADGVDKVVLGVREALPSTTARGSVDDIVLACGPFPRTPFEELRREDLERTLMVHAISPLLLVHALAADLAKARGAVVALGDAGVTRPYTNHVAYLTAKGAVQTGLKALSRELAPDVRVNMIELGIVADPEADLDPHYHHRLATRSPLGRFGSPAEVVHVVLALLDATWATGEVWGIGR